MKREMISEFKGLNQNKIISDNEFSEMQNIVSDDYPALSSGCSWRSEAVFPGKPYYMVYADTVNNKLCAVIYNTTTNKYDFYYDNVLKGEIGIAPDQITMIGSKICIFPNGFIYETTSGTLSSSTKTWNNQYEIEGSLETDLISCVICNDKGDEYSVDYTGVTAPIPGTGIWRNSSKTPNTLYAYNYATYVWEELITYIKITKTNSTNMAFSVGDYVTITGLTTFGTLTKVKVAATTSTYIVVPCPLYALSSTTSSVVTITKVMPNIKYVISHKNRLWGCSHDGREIYASALGNPDVWYDYDTLSTSSYAATVGTGNVFTGAVSYNGYIWFFKEDRVYKVYENNYPVVQIIEIPLDGIENGSYESIVEIDGSLYYKSPTDIKVFTGESFATISDNLDLKNKHNASAGTIDGKYYICFDSNVMYVYDTHKKMWHVENVSEVAVG